MQVDPIKPKLKLPGTKRLKLELDGPHSTFAFKFKLCRYTKAFLAAWEKEDPGPLPSAEALCCLPNTLGALCLSPAGLQRVQNSSALNALVTVGRCRLTLCNPC